jgi:2-polyprenyl-3-methyl-5-hydroxy-6-metoxy-1,4-benzoquinol methylase
MQIKTSTPAQVVEALALLNNNAGSVLSITAELPEATIEAVMKTSLWPQAVPPTMIVTTDTAKKVRAKSIMAQFVREQVQGKKFLDYGCGEGYCVSEAKNRGATLAMGYDIVLPNPPVQDVVSDLSVIETAGPYDVILLYDVLDHIIDDDNRNQALVNIRKFLKPGGKIFVRCHPFTSRHSVHCYYNFNKAYPQLFLPMEQLLGYGAIPTVQTLTPMLTYKQWFAKNGLKIVTEELYRQDMDEFFSTLTATLLKRLASNAFVKNLATLNQVLNIQFADFALQPV